MRRHAIIGVYICIVAIWTQLFAPAAAMSMSPDADPFSIVCTKAAFDRHGEPLKHQQPQHRHDCCLLCHGYLGAAPTNDRPACTAFDYAVSSPLRWRSASTSPVLTTAPRDSQPRGPPSLI